MIGIVLNPVSGGGKGKALADEAAALLASRGEEARIYESACEGGITERVREAIAEGCGGVACIGGDGSLSEAVQALCGSGVVFYVIPAGTGNDFARALGLPKDSMEAFRAQLEGQPAAIDCGLLNGKAFINISGSGFDVRVLERTEELKADYPGEQAYRKAVSDTIRHYVPFSPEIEIDGKRLESGAYAIAEIANGQYFGGGMRVAPDAQLDDGLFDVVLVRAVPRLTIPLLFPLFILGLHTRLPLAKQYRAKKVCLRAPGMTINIDGRLERMDEGHYEICPGALRMMRPIKTA
ncbi:MAG: diacylglycerol kinase family lipid kinase [Clostridia bacterium]|nr:diacylglycerol kinase family lipid kinase [Clostridia bacterium]